MHERNILAWLSASFVASALFMIVWTIMPISTQAQTLPPRPTLTTGPTSTTAPTRQPEDPQPSPTASATPAIVIVVGPGTAVVLTPSGGAPQQPATAVPPAATAVPPAATAIPPVATAAPPAATALPPAATTAPQPSSAATNRPPTEGNGGADVTSTPARVRQTPPSPVSMPDTGIAEDLSLAWPLILATIIIAGATIWTYTRTKRVG